MLASLFPTDETWSLRILATCEGSFTILLLLFGSLIAVIILVFFLRCKTSFIPSHVFFMFVL